MVARQEILNTEQVREIRGRARSPIGYVARLADSHELLRADRDALAEAIERYLERDGFRPALRAALAVHGSGKEPDA